MTFILHRHCHQSFPVAVAGDGPYLIDRDGKRYLDASGGAAVSSLGRLRFRFIFQCDSRISFILCGRHSRGIMWRRFER